MSMTGVGVATDDGQRSGSGAIRIGVFVLVVLAVVVMVVSRTDPGRRAFDLESTTPDGYAAIRILLEERGVKTTQVRANDVSIAALGGGSVLVVPDPDMATTRQLKSFVKAAERGAKVVFGSVPELTGGADPDSTFGSWSEFGPGMRDLADQPITISHPGICDIPELEDLGVIDITFTTGGLVPAALSEITELIGAGELAHHTSCYGTPDAAEFRVVDFPAPDSADGRGRIVVMESPYLWVNARLQPAKEAGGGVPDNAATAVRLLGGSEGSRPSTVAFVQAVRTAPTASGSTTHPVELLPFGVKLALAQLLVAFAIFVWWRSRRLGPALIEPLPVEIAGSELVSAMGRLRYRRNDIGRAAGILRASARRSLGMSLGVPFNAPLETLVAAVTSRTGRPHDAVSQLLGDSPVADREALVALANELESLRLESQDVHDR